MSIFSKSEPTSDPVVLNEAVEAPWLRAQRQHEDTFLRLAAQVGNWRKIAFACLLLTGVAVTGVIYIGSKSKFVTMIVEVDKLGRTLAVRALTGEEAVTDSRRLVYREMFDLIENLRTVTTDRKANDERLRNGFTRLSGAGRAYVRAELQKAPANDVGATKTVQVKVKSALPQAGKSWLIEWEEISVNLVGESLGPPELWRATLQYDLQPSGEEESIRKNPIGFTVPEISWQKVVL